MLRLVSEIKLFYTILQTYEGRNSNLIVIIWSERSTPLMKWLYFTISMGFNFSSPYLFFDKIIIGLWFVVIHVTSRLSFHLETYTNPLLFHSCSHFFNFLFTTSLGLPFRLLLKVPVTWVFYLIICLKALHCCNNCPYKDYVLYLNMETLDWTLDYLF